MKKHEDTEGLGTFPEWLAVWYGRREGETGGGKEEREEKGIKPS